MKITACLPCEEQPTRLPWIDLAASMCKTVDDHNNPFDSPHQFVDVGKMLLYLRQQWRHSSAPLWRYLSNRIFRLHTAYPVSLGASQQGPLVL
jgi:hypothetical protein